MDKQELEEHLEANPLKVEIHDRDLDTEQEAQWRLRALKGWMQKKGVPKSFQIKISEYCNELWSGKGFDTVELLYIQL